METKATITSPKNERDYFPALFSNKDNSIIILAEEKISDTLFSGMIIHSEGNNKKMLIGTSSSGWTRTQFKRLEENTIINLELKQQKNEL